MNVAMIGLGKLGLPCAEVMSDFADVTGFDLAEVTTEKKSLKIAKDFSKAVLGMDLIFVAVPTPHDKSYDGATPTSALPKKDFSYEPLQKVLKEINLLAPQSKVVVISTVLPGTVREFLAPLLPQGEIIYNPYFIAMGTVKEDFLNPEMIPIGSRTGTSETLNMVLEFYRKMGIQAPHTFGTWEEIESVKVFYNTFISFKLSFVNMIQDVAQRLGHTDVDVVTEALCRAGQRILSPSYMKAGMGDGGPCHPRDNIALGFLAEKLELGYDLFSGIMQSREAQAKNLADFLIQFGSQVCILGAAFKPLSPLRDGSYSSLVAHYLNLRNVEVSFFDPLCGFNVAPSKATVYLLAHPYEHWRNSIDFVPGSTIVDPWRSCPLIPNCKVVAYGKTH